LSKVIKHLFKVSFIRICEDVNKIHFKGHI
jgi:hypothetical protein